MNDLSQDYNATRFKAMSDEIFDGIFTLTPFEKFSIRLCDGDISTGGYTRVMTKKFKTSSYNHVNTVDSVQKISRSLDVGNIRFTVSLGREVYWQNGVNAANTNNGIRVPSSYMFSNHLNLNFMVTDLDIKALKLTRDAYIFGAYGSVRPFNPNAETLEDFIRKQLITQWQHPAYDKKIDEWFLRLQNLSKATRKYA